MELYERCLEKGFIGSNEKLILDKMVSYGTNLMNDDDLFETLSYISDMTGCVATVHNVAQVLQMQGEYNVAYEIVGRLIARFEDENPKELDRIEENGNFFFSDWNLNLARHGFHDFSHIPESCLAKKKKLHRSKRIEYFFAMYGNDEALKGALKRGGKYKNELIIEALRRELDIDFLRPIVEEAIPDKSFRVSGLDMLTHLEWGGEHLSLLRPLLIQPTEIDDLVDETRRACLQMEIAAHVGELDLAMAINDKCYSYAESKDFELDNADYFYEACSICGLEEEAYRWLENGCPDEFDLPLRIERVADFKCSRGESLEDVEFYDNPKGLSWEWVAGKWLNGFDVKEDIQFFLSSNLASSMDKLICLRYAIFGPTPYVNRRQSD